MTARRIKDILTARGQTLCAAESLTGGALMGEITRVQGVSRCFLGGVTAYQDDIKRAFLRVSADTLARHTAVSAACAREMASGARDAFHADYAVATTGYAGPDGDPPGRVYIAVSGKARERVYRFQFRGGRNAVRAITVQMALYLLEKELYANGEEGIDQEHDGHAGNDPRE